ncbi:MAG: type II secretion system F family protein [Candidatus Nealsonbacteria bacterium]|nr:type II secretion system F family protein [Candidatus Nealsonbacteria bacterium]
MTDVHPPENSRPGKLTTEQAVELAARVAELSQAGLPLPAGLRALGDELPGRRQRRSLHELADRMQAGQTLDGAVEALGDRFPAYVRGLIVAGVRSGRLAEVFEEFVELQRDHRELVRRVWTRLAYPIVLLTMLGGMLLFLKYYLIDEFVKIFEEFDAELPIVTQVFIGSSGAGLWLLQIGAALLSGTLVLAWLMPSAAWAPRVVYAVPLIGPLWRWSRLKQFSAMLAVLLRQEVPLPEALRLTADGVGEAHLALGCRRAAEQVEAGMPFSEALASHLAFPPSIIPLVEWGGQASAMDDALGAAAEMFAGRVQSQEGLMKTVVLPLTFLVVIGFVSFLAVAMMAPMVSLVRSLSFGAPMASQTPANMLVGPSLILLGIAVLAAMHLISPSGSLSQRNPAQLVLGVIGWVLIVVGCVGIAGGFLIVLGFGGLVLWGAVVVVGVQILVGRLTVRRRALLWVMTVAAERMIPLAPAVRAFAEEHWGLFARWLTVRRRALLWVLAVAAEWKIPLAPAVRAFAEERWRPFAQRARQMGDALVAGMPPSEAIERFRRLFPHEAVPILCVGCEAGALAPALRQAAARSDDHDNVWQSLTGKVVYLCLLPFGALGIASFIAWKILPAFVFIFDDFDVEMPLPTQVVIEVASLFFDNALLGVPIVLTAVSLLLYILGRYTGVIRWNLPGIDRITRRLDTAVVLEVTALMLQREHPLSQGVATLARTYPRRSIRRMLEKVWRDLQAGTDLHDSLYARGLIRRADWAVLRAAGSAGNLPWALNELADSNRRRMAYRLQALVHLLFPPVLIAIGALVGLFVVAMFLPMITLIEGVLGW